MLGVSLKAQVFARREPPKHTALCSPLWLSTSPSFCSLNTKAEVNHYASRASGCFQLELVSGELLYCYSGQLTPVFSSMWLQQASLLFTDLKAILQFLLRSVSFYSELSRIYLNWNKVSEQLNVMSLCILLQHLQGLLKLWNACVSFHSDFSSILKTWKKSEGSRKERERQGNVKCILRVLSSWHWLISHLYLIFNKTLNNSLGTKKVTEILTELPIKEGTKTCESVWKVL